MKTLTLLIGCLGSLVGVVTAAPIDDAKAALADFLEQPSYTWVNTGLTRGMPESGSDTELAAQGQHERFGDTKIHFTRGPHIPRDQWSLGRVWLGFTDEQNYWGQRWAYETPEGWKALRALPSPNGSPISPAPPSRPGAINIPLGRIGTGFTVRYTGVRRPDHEIAIVLKHLDRAEALGSGHYRAELSPECVEELIVPPPPPHPIPFRMSARNGQGTIEFWAPKGILTRYTISMEATVSPGQGQPRRFALHRELKDVGTTKIDIPPEAERLLRR